MGDRNVGHLIYQLLATHHRDIRLTTVSLPTRYADCLYICIRSGCQLDLTPAHIPICSVPLNTYNRQFFNGFLASGGSLYLICTPLTKFVSLASSPELPKLGFSGSFAGGASSYSISREPGVLVS